MDFSLSRKKLIEKISHQIAEQVVAENPATGGASAYAVYSTRSNLPATAALDTVVFVKDIDTFVVWNGASWDDTGLKLSDLDNRYEPKLLNKNSAFNKPFGTTDGTVADGGVVAAHGTRLDRLEANPNSGGGSSLPYVAEPDFIVPDNGKRAYVSSYASSLGANTTLISGTLSNAGNHNQITNPIVVESTDTYAIVTVQISGSISNKEKIVAIYDKEVVTNTYVDLYDSGTLLTTISGPSYGNETVDITTQPDFTRMDVKFLVGGTPTDPKRVRINGLYVVAKAQNGLRLDDLDNRVSGFQTSIDGKLDKTGGALTGDVVFDVTDQAKIGYKNTVNTNEAGVYFTPDFLELYFGANTHLDIKGDGAYINNKRILLEGDVVAGSGSNVADSDTNGYILVNGTTQIQVYDDSELRSLVATGMTFKGTVATHSDLPVSATKGDMYVVQADETDNGTKNTYVYDGTVFVRVGSTDVVAGSVVEPSTNGYIKVDGTNTLVYQHPASHTISEVSGLQNALDNKSDNGHIHAISDVTGLQTNLDGKITKPVGIQTGQTIKYDGANFIATDMSGGSGIQSYTDSTKLPNGSSGDVAILTSPAGFQQFGKGKSEFWASNGTSDYLKLPMYTFTDIEIVMSFEPSTTANQTLFDDTLNYGSVNLYYDYATQKLVKGSNLSAVYIDGQRYGSADNVSLNQLALSKFVPDNKIHTYRFVVSTADAGDPFVFAKNTLAEFTQGKVYSAKIWNGSTLMADLMVLNGKWVSKFATPTPTVTGGTYQSIPYWGEVAQGLKPQAFSVYHSANLNATTTSATVPFNQVYDNQCGMFDNTTYKVTFQEDGLYELNFRCLVTPGASGQYIFTANWAGSNTSNETIIQTTPGSLVPKMETAVISRRFKAGDTFWITVAHTAGSSTVSIIRLHGKKLNN